jgi:uncharacterized repeat protein (TIGR01451 family)
MIKFIKRSNHDKLSSFGEENAMKLQPSFRYVASVLIILTIVLFIAGIASLSTGTSLASPSAQGSEPASLPPLQAKSDITLPYIELWPDAAGVGETVAVRGLNFCPTAECAALRIRVNDMLVLDDVSVNSDGTFVTYITASDPQGLQRIGAEQTDLNGLTLSDSKALIVMSPGQDAATQQSQNQIPVEPIFSPVEPRPNYEPSESEIIETPVGPQSPEVIAFQPNIKWGGRTVAVDAVPANRNEAIAATETGGLFRTTNLGVNWTHLDNLPAFRMYDVKYASPDGSIVIASSAYNSRAANDGGIWRSTDHGVSWNKPATSTPLCSGGRVNTYGITVVFSRNEVYVGTDCGLAISHDQGATWMHVSNWNSGTPRVFSVAARDYGGPGSVVDLCGDFGHRRSTDGGTSWTSSNDLPAPYAYCPSLAVHGIALSPIDQNVLFITKWDSPIVCNGNTVARYAVYESDNGGTSWIRRYFGCGISRPPSIFTDTTPSAGQIVVYFSDGLSLRQQYCSGVAPNPRCGTTWTDVPVDHSDVNGLVVDPGYYCLLYVVSDGGVHKGTDPCGGSFSIIGAGNAGYQALQVYEVQSQVHPGLPTDLYFGTKDNDLWSSVDSGATWPGEICCEGFFISLLHNTPNNIGQKINFTACADCVNLQSGPLWAGWTYWNNPPNSGYSPVIIETNVYIQFSQVNPPSNTTNILYITTNNGGIWTQVPGVAISEPLGGQPLISGPALNPTVYIGVQKAGGSWGLRKITNVRGPGSAVVVPADSGLNNIGIYLMGQGTLIVPLVVGVNPSNPNHLIAADVGSQQMKVSTNGGASWTNIPELTNLVMGNGRFAFMQGTILQPHFVQWDPSNTNRIFVSTDEAGVLYSPNGGLSWGRLVGSEMVVNGANFAFDEVLGRTLVASYGRGLWQLEFTQADISIVKSSPSSIGSQVHYAITVTNNGPAIAENTIMTDTLPANTTFTSLAISSAGWLCTTPAVGATGTVSCNGGDRANGDVSTFTLVLNVNAGVPAGSPICNTAYARSDILDNTPGDSAFTCSTELGDLVVDRSDDANISTCLTAPNDCTLRGAINKVNGLNTDHALIRFDPSVLTIGLTSSLPVITARGTAIIGAAGTPLLNGAGMANGDAIKINAAEVVIKGLSIVNVPSGGVADVHVLSGLGIQIADNYLGTFPEVVGVTTCTPGSVTRNAAYGVLVDGGVSGTNSNPALWVYGNRVACHSTYGLVMFGSDGAIIGRTPAGVASGNYIGTNANDAILPNGVGVGLLANGGNGARYHTVVYNTIQYNNNAGVWLLGTGTNNTNSTSSNLLAGNLIVGNGQTNGAGGVYLSGGAYYNIIGGQNDEDINIIEANHGNGISLFDSDSNGILGNHIGNQHGHGNNTGSGIYISNGTSNWVGGFFFVFGSLKHGNVIGGNNLNGVELINGTTGTLLTQNKIGTNVTVTAPISNTLSGVSISLGAHTNRIGDGTFANENVIAGNGKNGVSISGSTTMTNTITFNDIGLSSQSLINDTSTRALDLAQPTTPDVVPLPNHEDGVLLQDNTSGNVITAATWIAYNLSGVRMMSGAHDNLIQNASLFNNIHYGALFEGAATSNNTVKGSTLNGNGYDGIGEKGGAYDNRWSHISTFSNGGLGIDLAITDDLQNTLTPPWPVITQVIPSGSSTIVRGTANGTYSVYSTQVELYTVAPDPSGHGEGRSYLGTAPTDASGNWQITLPGTSNRCFTAFETDFAVVIENYWRSTEFGPNTCQTYLPLLQK